MSHDRLNCGPGWPVAAMVLVLAAAWLPASSRAEEPNQAGLVIQFGDGRVEARCIDFEQDAIRGADLLITSGLEVVIDASSGMGIILCQVEGSGCAYPAEPCFCQCTGGDTCAYWNYFYRDPGDDGWSYSPLGAVLRKVVPGSVEAWVWGNGKTAPAEELTFEAVCGLGKPTPTLTVEPSALATVLPSPALALPASTPTTAPARASATARPTASATDESRPAGTTAPAGNAGTSIASYWPFALFVVILAATGIAVLRRPSR